MAVAANARRRRLEPADARELVLGAAEDLLFSGGPDALRLTGIAARAGVSHSNVLYHFETMRDLRAQLGRRIALRLAAEIADVYVRHEGEALPIERANRHLFAVMDRGRYAQLLSWMLFNRDVPDLEGLEVKLREICDLIVSHPSLAAIPQAERRRDVVATIELAICAALGYGLVGARLHAMFGGAERPSLPTLLTDLFRTRIERHACP